MCVGLKATKNVSVTVRSVRQGHNNVLNTCKFHVFVKLSITFHPDFEKTLIFK
jgi:hypothetical protein